MCSMRKKTPKMKLSIVGVLNIIYCFNLKLKCSGIKCYSSLTCCRLGVDEIVAAKWRGVVLGDSKEEDDEQFDWELLSNCWRKLSVLHAITGETSFDNGMAEACDVTDAYEYSNGFVIAMSEFKISGVRGVLDPKSIPTPSKGGVESDVLKLYIFYLFTRSFDYRLDPWCNPVGFSC